MKKVFLLISTLFGLIVFYSCEKNPSEEPTPTTYTLTSFVFGMGTVTPAKLSGILPGSSVILKFTPEKDYSLYSVEINGSKVKDIQPSAVEVQYTYKDIKNNILVKPAFVETLNLLISNVLNNSPWKLKSMNIYKDDGTFLFSFPLLQEDKEIKRYFYYPQGEVKMYYPDGSLYWSSTWSISGNNFRLGGGDMTIIELTASRLVFKAPPGADPTTGIINYAQYTYERN